MHTNLHNHWRDGHGDIIELIMLTVILLLKYHGCPLLFTIQQDCIKLLILGLSSDFLLPEYKLHQLISSNTYDDN